MPRFWRFWSKSSHSHQARPSMDEEKVQFLAQLAQYRNAAEKKFLTLQQTKQIKSASWSSKEQVQLDRRQNRFNILKQLEKAIEDNQQTTWSLTLQAAIQQLAEQHYQKSKCYVWLVKYAKRYQVCSEQFVDSQCSSVLSLETVPMTLQNQFDNSVDGETVSHRHPPSLNECEQRFQQFSSAFGETVSQKLNPDSIRSLIAMAIQTVTAFIGQLEQEIKNRYFAFLNRWFPMKQQKVSALNALVNTLQTMQGVTTQQMWEETIKQHGGQHPVLLKGRFSHRTQYLLTNLFMRQPERGILKPDPFSSETWQATTTPTKRCI